MHKTCISGLQAAYRLQRNKGGETREGENVRIYLDCRIGAQNRELMECENSPMQAEDYAMSEYGIIRQELILKREILKERLNRIRQELRQKKNADSEEQATERGNDSVLEALETSMIKELEQIETTLRQMEKGSYGLCSSCGEAISEKRLQVLPYTSVCVVCATAS